MQLTKDTLSQVDFAKSELIPAIVQDASSGVILMQGFMNQDALAATFDKQKVTFYSRSKERLPKAKHQKTTLKSFLCTPTVITTHY